MMMMDDDGNDDELGFSCQGLRNFLESAAPLGWDESSPVYYIILYCINRTKTKASEVRMEARSDFFVRCTGSLPYGGFPR